MKKTLVALAVAGVIAPVAQADNVVIYGRLNTSVEHVKIQDGSKKVRENNDASRFGLKGEEKIGNLTAEFQIENGFDSTGASNTGLASRDTFVGIKGDFGGVRVGRNETPTYKLFDGTIAKFHNAGIAAYDISAATGARALSGISTVGARLSNSVLYRSPDFANFSGALQVADAQTVQGIAGTTTRFVDGSLVYGANNSPITAGFAFRTNKNVASDKQDTIYLLSGKYKQDLFDISLAYERDDSKSVDTKIDKVFVSGQYNLGNAALVASFGSAGKAKVAGNSVADTNALQYTLGAQYDLSNRTQVYGYYTKLDNKDAATYNFIAGTPAGKDNQGFVLGLRHNF